MPRSAASALQALPAARTSRIWRRRSSLNCEHVDFARRELRVLDAKTPAGGRRVDIHDDLQNELAAYKAARSSTWQPGTPAFLNAPSKRWTRSAIAQHVLPPALKEANRSTRCCARPRSPRPSTGP
jgi:hypothetical protein